MLSKIREIRDIISKPSEALRAMVDGLLEQSQRKDFVIDMVDWGSTDGKVCYGCAATCTLQKLSGNNLIPSITNIRSKLDWRADTFGFSENDINVFENAVDNARMGDLERLFRYFNIDSNHIEIDTVWCLCNDDWKEQIPQVEETIHYLISKGV